MELGAFSVSSAVKDLKVSKAFYENLDFQVLCSINSFLYIGLLSDN